MLRMGTEGCSLGASEVGWEEKVLLSTTTTKKAEAYKTECVITLMSGQCKI